MTKEAENALGETVRAWLGDYEARNAEACANWYTPDARIFQPEAWGPFAQGREAIRKVHQQWFGGDSAKTLEILEVGADGATGYCLVRFLETTAFGTEESGISLNVMKLIPGEGWRFHISSLTEEPA